MDGVGGFLVITVSHPTFCCVGVGLWLRWGWAVTFHFLPFWGHFGPFWALSGYFRGGGGVRRLFWVLCI